MLSSMKTETHTGWISETFNQNWLSGINQILSSFVLFWLRQAMLVRRLSTRGLVEHLIGGEL